MTLSAKLLFTLLLFSAQISLAQSTLPPSPEMQRAYHQGTRDKNGAPGKNYGKTQQIIALKLPSIRRQSN